jgi:hypothetical protein
MDNLDDATGYDKAVSRANIQASCVHIQQLHTDLQQLRQKELLLLKQRVSMAILYF